MRALAPRWPGQGCATQESAPLFLNSAQPLAEPLVLSHHSAHLREHVFVSRLPARGVAFQAQHNGCQDAHVLFQRQNVIPHAADLVGKEIEGYRAVAIRNLSASLVPRAPRL